MMDIQTGYNAYTCLYASDHRVLKKVWLPFLLPKIERIRLRSECYFYSVLIVLAFSLRLGEQ